MCITECQCDWGGTACEGKECEARQRIGAVHWEAGGALWGGALGGGAPALERTAGLLDGGI